MAKLPFAYTGSPARRADVGLGGVRIAVIGDLRAPRADPLVRRPGRAQLIAPANDQVVPFLGVATLPEGGAIALACSGNGVTTVESVDTKLVATKIGALH